MSTVTNTHKPARTHITFPNTLLVESTNVIIVMIDIYYCTIQNMATIRYNTVSINTGLYCIRVLAFNSYYANERISTPQFKI